MGRSSSFASKQLYGGADRHRDPLLRPGNETTTARLILAIGSRSGLEAPLQIGYYMIGRHQECQIRPKSRSVSRRHCLIEHHEGGLRILDLGSASGTYVNGRRLEPKRWSELSDGASLRCGKVLFQVRLDHSKHEKKNEPVGAGVAGGSVSMVTGQAWQDVDVAGFLEAEDEAEREQRYQSIRSGKPAPDAGTDDLEVASDHDTDIDLGVFDDTFDDAQIYTSVNRPNSDSSGNEVDLHADADLARTTRAQAAPRPAKRPQAEKPAEEKPAEEKPAKNKRKSAGSSRIKGKSPSRAAAPMTKKLKKPRAARSAPSIDLSAEGLKKIGAVLIALAVLGFCGYTFYDFYQGPDVRVVEGID